MQKMIAFHHDKKINLLKLGSTLPNLANTCLHKTTDANFYPITEGDKDCRKKTRRCCLLLVVHRPFLQAIQLLMKILFVYQQTYANLRLGLMLANKTSTRCVNSCQPFLLRVGISIQRRV